MFTYDTLMCSRGTHMCVHLLEHNETRVQFRHTCVYTWKTHVFTWNTITCKKSTHVCTRGKHICIPLEHKYVQKHRECGKSARVCTRGTHICAHVSEHTCSPKAHTHARTYKMCVLWSTSMCTPREQICPQMPKNAHLKHTHVFTWNTHLLTWNTNTCQNRTHMCVQVEHTHVYT